MDIHNYLFSFLRSTNLAASLQDMKLVKNLPRTILELRVGESTILFLFQDKTPVYTPANARVNGEA